MNTDPISQNGQTITQSQLGTLQASVQAGNFTQFYLSLHNYGSIVAGLYIPGPTGIGIFGSYSHLISIEAAGREFFRANQYAISDAIANAVISEIEASPNPSGGFYLPSIHKILATEIQVFSDFAGLGSEAYAGHDLIEYLGIEGVPGAIEDGVAGSDVLDGFGAFFANLLAGGTFEYANETLSYSDRFYLEGGNIQYIQHPALGVIPAGIGYWYTAKLLSALQDEVTARQNPDFFLNPMSELARVGAVNLQLFERSFGTIMNSIYGESAVSLADGGSVFFSNDGLISVGTPSALANWFTSFSLGNECFTAGTKIDMWPRGEGLVPTLDCVYDKEKVLAGIWTKPIEEITADDWVVATDKLGNLVPGKVDKLFTNTTSEFIRLSFEDNRDDLVTTPGHRFLTETGDYMEIGQMLRLSGGKARVVDLDGSIIEINGELLVYSAETAQKFPENQTKTIAVQGNTVLKQKVKAGWQTYNFEVREHHNYVAGGVRVHNDSILSNLNPGDELIALSDDLRDAIVLRNVDVDDAREIVLLDGYEATNGSTALESTINLSASGATLGVLDLEATLATVAANNPLLASQPEALFTLFEAAVALFPGQTVSSTVDVSSSGAAIDGTSAGQSWSGTSADEWYRGNGGNDSVIRGNGGDDILEGGDGNDTIRGGTGEDMLIGDGGADKLYGDADDDLLNGGAGNDRLYGNDGDDTLIGGVGDDNLEGGQGDDNLQGGTGNDTIYTSYKTVNQYGNDLVKAGFGDDFIMGSNGKDKLYGDSGNDELNGGNDYSSADRDYLDGGYGNDIVISGQDRAPTSQTQANGDLLFGNDGDDTLIGGMANDVMNGGSGVDKFVFLEDFGHDKIEDFNTSSGNEVIDLSDIDLFSSFSNVQGSMVDTGSDIVISTQNGADTITLVGVENISDLFSTDFIYS